MITNPRVTPTTPNPHLHKRRFSHQNPMTTTQTTPNHQTTTTNQNLIFGSGVKETRNLISNLQQENFNLKMKLHFLASGEESNPGMSLNNDGLKDTLFRNNKDAHFQNNLMFASNDTLHESLAATDTKNATTGLLSMDDHKFLMQDNEDSFDEYNHSRTGFSAAFPASQIIYQNVQDDREEHDDQGAYGLENSINLIENEQLESLYDEQDARNEKVGIFDQDHIPQDEFEDHSGDYEKQDETVDSLANKDLEVTNDNEDEDQSENQESQEQKEFEDLQQEFFNVAQQAYLEIEQLQLVVKQQQEEIQALKNERLLQSNTLLHDAATQSSLVQTFTSDVQTEEKVVFNQSSQIKPFMRDCSVQTDLIIEPPAQPIRQVKKPTQIQIESHDPFKSEYEKNKQRYIEELKERNLLLVRISQNLDAKLGTAHIGSNAVTSFPLLKQTILEKMKSLGNIYQEKIDYQSRIKQLEKQIADFNQDNIATQIKTLQQTLHSAKSQIAHERENASVRVAELIQSKKRLENQLELAMKKMVLLESKMTSVDSHHDTRTVDGDLYQRQYISALSDMQTLQTRISTLEYKIKFSHAHLNKYFTCPEKPVYLTQAIKALKLE